MYVTGVNLARPVIGVWKYQSEMSKLYRGFLKFMLFGVRGIPLSQNIYCLYSIVYKFSGIFG